MSSSKKREYVAIAKGEHSNNNIMTVLNYMFYRVEGTKRLKGK